MQSVRVDVSVVVEVSESTLFLRIGYHDRPHQLLPLVPLELMHVQLQASNVVVPSVVIPTRTFPVDDASNSAFLHQSIFRNEISVREDGRSGRTEGAGVPPHAGLLSCRTGLIGRLRI
jgi:hypothetical protein